MGLVSPIGCSLDEVWQNLTHQNSGIAPLQLLPTEILPFRSGGEARDFKGEIGDFGPLEKPLMKAIKKNMRVMCREIEMGVAASQKALTHSGLGVERDPDRIGCIFGCDYILTRPEEYEDGYRTCAANSGGDIAIGDWPTLGLPKVNPLWLLKYLPNMPNSHVSIYNDLRGPNNALTVREASMGLSVAEATRIIQRGSADAMLVGATGCRIHPMRTPQTALTERLAAECQDPSKMSRPFDQSCDGMVVGEGAGALLIESYEHASSRGAKIWGEVLATSATMANQPDQLETALRLAYQNAIDSCDLPSEWHFHAQGTCTLEADSAEAAAINGITNGKVPVTAAKSYFGNLGAGSGAVELICSLLALEHNQLFPILNLENPIAAANWSSAPHQPGQAFAHSSFTLQGQTSCLILGKTT